MTSRIDLDRARYKNKVKAAKPDKWDFRADQNVSMSLTSNNETLQLTPLNRLHILSEERTLILAGSMLIILATVFLSLAYRRRLRRLLNELLHFKSTFAALLTANDHKARITHNFVSELHAIASGINQLLTKVEDKAAEQELNVSELCRLQKIIEEHLHKDRLTQLYNRHHFEEHLPQVLGRATQQGKEVALLIVDLDNFKLVNDTLGYRLGDQLLKMIAQRLSGLLSPHHYHCRLGGDEFCIVMEDIKTLHSVKTLSNMVLTEISNMALNEMGDEFETGDSPVSVQTTIGISIFPLDAHNESNLLRNADIALHEGKRKGKGCAVFFSADLATVINRRYLIESCLRNANYDEEFELYFQPQFEIATGRLTGVETLLRWHSPKIGSVSPTEFIPIAEDTGIIVELGKWVIREACKQGAIWHASNPNLMIGINLSGRQLLQIDLVDEIEKILGEYKINPNLIDLEVTETFMVHHLADCVAKLKALKTLGLRISLDDFGTGFSSMSYLKSYPIDTLKIDRSFINDIHHDHEDQAITLAILEMASALDIETIAEGVEIQGQIEFLKKSRCDRVQGFLYAPPLSKTEMDTRFMTIH